MNVSNYVRLTKGLVSRGNLYLSNEYMNKVSSEDEYFVSTYQYNKMHFETFKKTGSIAGITDVTTNNLWFDFDSEVDVDLARLDTKEVIKRLINKNINEKDIEVYFSGNKGFHVIVTTNRSLTPTQVQSICLNKFGKDLKTIDPSVYDASQLFRVPGTKNKYTNLYKIPLTIKQLDLSVEEIKKLAKSLDNVKDEFDWGVVQLDESLLQQEPAKIEKKKSVTMNYNLTNKPKDWKIYKWALVQGLFEIGERHNAMMVIASTCRSLQYDRDTTRAICLAADEKHCARTGHEAIDDLDTGVLRDVFSDKWKGGSFSPETNPWLKSYCERMNFETERSECVKITDLFSGFKTFVNNIDQNTIKTGIIPLDEAISITTGTNIAILGAPSSGKSSIALEILKNTSMSGVQTVFASLDMHRNRILEKLLYKVSVELGGEALNRKELYGMFQSNREAKLFDKVKEQYGNVNFFDRSSPTVENIKDYVNSVQDKTGEKVKLVVIDYFERIMSEMSDETASSKKVAGQLQDLLMDLDVALVTLVQPNKHSIGGGPDKPLLNYSGIKGSSFLSQSFRGIVSLWRPFFTPLTKDMDKFMEMAILKNDLGELDNFKFNWVGKTGAITECSEEDLALYEEYMTKKKTMDGSNDKNSYDNWGR